MSARGKKNQKVSQADTSLSETTILARVGERSFRLGKEYFSANTVFDCRWQGTTIRARCQGQSAEPYSQYALVEDGRIREASCSCPVGSGGACKHVAAVLLAFMHEQHEFEETVPLDKLLAGCSQAKLIELIRKMIEQEPDLESWLELAVQTIVPSKEVVKPEAYQRKAVRILNSIGSEWGEDEGAVEALESLQEFGGKFFEQQNFESAAAVYCGILQGFLQSYDTEYDREGDISSAAGSCITALGNCFDQLATETTIRQLALTVLLDMVFLDSALGGVSLADEAYEIIGEKTTPAERAGIAQRIREELSAATDSSSEYERRSWGGWLLELEGAPTDDEAFFKHCREFGLTSAAIDRLLERGRLDDALQEIRAASSDYELIGYADLLVKHQQDALAYKLIQERFQSQSKTNRGQLQDWLKRYYEARQDWQSILKLCIDSFDQRSGLFAYQEIRKLAQTLKSWEKLQPQIISQIPKTSNELIRIHLDDGNLETAIALLDSRANEPRTHYSYHGSGVNLEVAQAAEKSHPETALKIYRQQSEALIDSRCRSSYKSACEYLQKVRDLYKALGRNDDWLADIAEFRKKYKILRALQEELTTAGL